MNSKKNTYLREITLNYKFKQVDSKVIDSSATDPKTIVQMFSDLQNETKEKFIAISIDARNKIICYEVVAIGSVNAVYLRPGEVVRTAVMVNATGIIVVHNHPSGDPEPSREDLIFTHELKEGAKFLGIELYDHIIIGIEDYFSFAEKGILFTLNKHKKSP